MLWLSVCGFTAQGTGAISRTYPTGDVEFGSAPTAIHSVAPFGVTIDSCGDRTAAAVVAAVPKQPSAYVVSEAALSESPIIATEYLTPGMTGAE
jgi:hypothetical protein